MTPPTGTAPRAVALPLLGRMILGSGLLAAAYATALFAQYAERFALPWAAAGLLVVSVLVPALLADVARRGGELSDVGAGLVIVTVFGVSLLLPALLPPELRVSAAWNWGTGGMTLLALAAYRPIAWSALLGIGHAALAVVVARTAGLEWVAVEVAAVSAALPAVAASAYLQFYARAVRSYAAALSDRAASETTRGELETLRMAGDQRLAAVRQESMTLLRAVVAADGLSSPHEAARARRLAGELRSALVENRRSLWLPTEVNGVPVRLLAAPGIAERASEPDRAWLAALLRVLGESPGVRELRVVLDLSGGPSTCDLVVTARLDDGPALADDGRLQSLCAQRSVRVEAENDLLLVEGRLQ